MTLEESLVKSAECTHRRRSTMSNSAWCDLNKDCTALKLHDICFNPKYNCQKQLTFSPRKFQLEGCGFENTTIKLFNGSQTAWNNLLKPAVNTLAPVIGMAVGAKSKNLKVAQATTNILNSISGGNILSLTDMHGNGLRQRVM